MLNFPDYFLRTLYGHGSVDVKLTLKQAMGSRCISLLFLEPRRYGGGLEVIKPKPLPFQRPATDCARG